MLVYYYKLCYIIYSGSNASIVVSALSVIEGSSKKLNKWFHMLSTSKKNCMCVLEIKPMIFKI